MKKIILTALTVLMIFGLVGCNGVLHDFVDPPAPPGNWYYVDVPTDTKNIIINFDSTDTNIDADGNGIVQSADIEVDVSEGSVYYTFYADVKEKAAGQYVKATENLPESKAGRVWVFAEKADIRVYYWGGSEDASWPGVGLTKEGETPAAPPVYPTPYYFDGMYLVGCGCVGDHFKFNADKLLWNPTLTKATGELVYTTEFTYNNSIPHDGWDHTNDGNVAIKLSTLDWKTSWGKTTIEAGKDYVELEKSSDNSFVKGLTDGTKYRLYVKTTPDEKVYAKVVTLTPVTVSGATVTATGLPEALNGKKLYFTGDFNGWKKPGEDGAIEGIVTDGEITITLPNFSKDFEGAEKQEFTVEGKFASGDGTWARPEIGVKEGNIKFTVTAEKKALIGTFVEKTPHKDGGDIYVCDWVVE